METNNYNNEVLATEEVTQQKKYVNVVVKNFL